ncbi:MAG: hypothetical protein ACC662_04295 [Planctomycetota bacterium]
MQRAVLLLAVPVALALALLLSLALAGAGVEGSESSEATKRFDTRIDGIRQGLMKSNETIRTVLQAGDWRVWNQAQDAYVRTLKRATEEVESTMATYMIAVLDAGDTLDAIVLDRIETAAAVTGEVARHKALVTAYAQLIRTRVKPSKRKDALHYLASLDVYDLERPPCNAEEEEGAAPQVSKGDVGPSPMSGRVPGSATARQHLGKWQFAYMQAESLRQRIPAMEEQLEALAEDSSVRPLVEESLEDERTRYEALVETITRWRTKYYEAGGK